MRLWLLTATEPSYAAFLTRYRQARARHFRMQAATRDEALWAAQGAAPSLKGWAWTVEELHGPVGGPRPPELNITDDHFGGC